MATGHVGSSYKRFKYRIDKNLKLSTAAKCCKSTKTLKHVRESPYKVIKSLFKAIGLVSAQEV